MKNPFLQDRNIFSKVQKPLTKPSKNDNQPQNTTDKIPSYDSKYALKPQTKPLNTIPSNPRANNQIPSTYQRQSTNYPSNHTNLTTNKYSSQKITFGDPMSSQAYHGDRTSGYFNMMNSQQQNSIKPVQQNKYDNLKYEPKKNNFFEPDSKQSENQLSARYDMKETRKQFGKYGSYGNKNQNLKMEYEFSPPPINNFTTTQPIQNRYRFEGNNYQYKSSYQTNQQRPYQTTEQKPYPNTKQSFTNDSNLINKKNPFTSNSYKSPPKQYDPLVTPKNDISQRFKDNNYAQFSPIGQVSRHKINQDSIMNLDGIMDGIELDKLLAQSKTQDQLLKLLGMDASMIKKNHDSGNKYQTQNQFKPNKYENRHTETNAYTSYYNPNQRQNQFTKKPYQPQFSEQQNRFQNFKDQDNEPQVFNYGESSIKNITHSIKPVNNQTQNYRQSPTEFAKPANNTYRPTQKNAYHYSQITDQGPNKNQNHSKNSNQEEEYDLQRIMQKQMEKFMIEQEGFSRDRRVFITANEKIIAKKYKLQSL